jgi:hypothetical protein
MSEQTVMEGIQTVIRALSEFSNSDVTINDWDVLDAAGANAPYFIIENSDTWNSIQGAPTAESNWEIVGNLIYYLADTDWVTGMNGFRDARQAIINAFNAAGNARSAGGLEATNIERIRAETPITYIFPHGIDPEFDTEAVPVFAAQSMVFEVEEY